MEEVKEKQRLTFVYPNGEEWFDLTMFAERYRNYLIRDKLGNNKSIHKINVDEEHKLS